MYKTRQVTELNVAVAENVPQADTRSTLSVDGSQRRLLR